MTLSSCTITSCPACGCDTFENTGSVAAGFSVVIDDRTFHQPDYSIRECASCGLLYRDQTLTGSQLDDYYSRVDFQKWEITGHFPTEHAALSILRQLPRGSRILDFGCSSGRLLAPLVVDYDCYGIEINDAAAKIAASKGIKMLPNNGLELEAPDTFEAVVMVDVFEHLSAPTELLRALFRLVKQGGMLMIITGNGDVQPCRLDPAQFWYFRNVEHLCMLTHRCAVYLASKLGGDIDQWEVMSHYDTSLSERVCQWARHFAYWQFRHQTFLAKTILPLVPWLKRAALWPVAPTYTVGRDHVLAVIRKI